ncbi:hypothetical protein acsn021_06150 [Anaerocolumna cellulosilytica]|uniref:Uncharacterized protein n=1 Tax=Anaerocolumna cellulosilytica TaxID=433286 RepID=A0A6S6QTP5_9FIRM|nr:DUF4280 domain-containing protein [Anaerocolumna cellulosilytica]MBB5197742.1 hypothetical protein [Anaerocolumna cellulosilytica]BCJ93046.1 hypothetical protein acsn021_06150 [Anaerocolumna cellulosilytica]
MSEIITEGSNEELSEDEKKLLLEEVQKSRDLGDEEAPSNLMVRGALLRCSCGTHPRRLNLPKSYGVYATDTQHPKVHELNNLVGDDKNIAYFGVCKSNNPPQSDTITLEPYVTPEGKKTSDSNAEGKKCEPIILGNWLDSKENDLIYDEDNDKKVPCLTVNAFTVCKYGGVIVPLTSGQEYNGD